MTRDDQTLDGLVHQREMNPSVDLPQLNRAIHRQAVMTVRWCLLFHRRDHVAVDSGNDPPTYAVDVDDRGLDYALRWLPGEVITGADADGGRCVRLVDLDRYLAENVNPPALP